MAISTIMEAGQNFVSTYPSLSLEIWQATYTRHQFILVRRYLQSVQSVLEEARYRSDLRSR